MLTIEERFWSQVWRCHHHWPCKRCCWPWRAALLHAYTHTLRPGYGRFYVTRFHPLNGPAHRIALVLSSHALFLPFGRDTAVCHLCDFDPCCNPAHLVFGTQHDNISRMALRGYFYHTHAPVFLPDGTRFSFDAREESLAAMYTPKDHEDKKESPRWTT